MPFSKSVFYHEDNYRQIDILPIQNIFSVQQEADKISELSEEDYTGDGFLKAYAISQTKYPLEKLNINRRVFEALLKEDSLFYFDEVYTGYSSYTELKKDTYAFGYENYVIYYTVLNNIVTAIWVDYNFLSDTLNERPMRLKTTLYKIGVLYKLMLVDWNQDISVDLSKEIGISSYIKQVLS